MLQLQGMKPADIDRFQELVLRHYESRGRHDLPWRLPTAGVFDPYAITVSELMLQQTQVPRVIPKYQAFLTAFPTVQALAGAPLSEVLTLWNGLGYNRRAKFLWQTAQQVTREHGGVFPAAKEALVRLPGVGPNTAGAIAAYAYNQPVVFIETNVRTVFIHHFFQDRTGVADGELLPLVEAAIPPDNPREWYWALMDYGTHLKQTVGNVSRASKGYVKQSKFQGSRRQIRGQVLRLLTAGPHTFEGLAGAISDERLAAVLETLIAEGFIARSGDFYHLRML